MSTTTAREALEYGFHAEFQKLYLVLLVGIFMTVVSPLGWGLAISMSLGSPFAAWMWLLVGLLLWIGGMAIVLTSVVSIAYRFRRTS